MRGSVPPPRWPQRRPAFDVPRLLRAELAESLAVAPDRVIVSHGASEGNAWVLGYLARRGRGSRAPVARLRYPEYPPLFGAARALGFRLRAGPGPAEVAVASRPRNPEGDLWTEEAVRRFAEGPKHLLVDETFREFAGVPSMASTGTRGLWATGSFTKFFGADEVRVGFAIAPPEEARAFSRYVGLVSDEVAPYSAEAARRLLRRREAVRREVRSVIDRNLRALAAAFPGRALPVGPMVFDRPGTEDGTALARRCTAASVLVAPGAFFGSPRGVRVCLTRRDFPDGLSAYLAVRGARAAGSARPSRV
jgi:histidinol-phosphate/aromatic aminotransferase/cobyric acid decarboxylase-like protein